MLQKEGIQQVHAGCALVEMDMMESKQRITLGSPPSLSLTLRALLPPSSASSKFRWVAPPSTTGFLPTLELRATELVSSHPRVKRGSVS